jgi:hypothetical protein
MAVGMPGGYGTSQSKKEQKMQEDALKKLIKEREAYAKAHKGNWPSDEQLMKARKKKP